MSNSSNSTEWPETKRRIVDASVNLMRTRGFNATSLDDICAAAGVTKGGFFHYFKNKDEIARAALAEFAEQRARAYASAPFRNLADPLDRVFGRLDFAMESMSAGRGTKGCLIGMLAQELSLTNSGLRDVSHTYLSRMAEDFEKDLTDAKARYAPKAALDPKKLANLYVATVQGSLLMAKAAASNEAISQNIEQLRHYLEILFGRTAETSAKRAAKLPAQARN